MGKDVKYSITFTAMGNEDEGLIDGGEAAIILDVPEDAKASDTLGIVTNGLAILLASECIKDGLSIEQQLDLAERLGEGVAKGLTQRLMTILSSRGHNGAQGTVRA